MCCVAQLPRVPRARPGRGAVTSVTAGAAMSSVKVRLEGGQDVTMDAAKELRLAEGSAVKVLVKATEGFLAAA